MFLRTLFVLAAAALGALGAATSVNVDRNATIVVGTEDTEFGSLVFYGRADHGAPSVKPKQEECGPPEVQCSQKLTRAPDPELCEKLLETLAASPEDTIPDDAIGVCATREPVGLPWCCVGWDATVPGLQYGDLIPEAKNLLARCVVGEGRAGFTLGVSLQGVCTRECLATLPCVVLG